MFVFIYGSWRVCLLDPSLLALLIAWVVSFLGVWSVWMCCTTQTQPDSLYLTENPIHFKSQ